MSEQPNDSVETTIAGWVACPCCGDEVPVGLSPLNISTNEDGTRELSADLQMDDVWAHAWTHDSWTETE